MVGFWVLQYRRSDRKMILAELAVYVAQIEGRQNVAPHFTLAKKNV
jgi:hypothetical protein